MKAQRYSSHPIDCIHTVHSSSQTTVLMSSHSSISASELFATSSSTIIRLFQDSARIPYFTVHESTLVVCSSNGSIRTFPLQHDLSQVKMVLKEYFKMSLFTVIIINLIFRRRRGGVTLAPFSIYFLWIQLFRWALIVCGMELWVNSSSSFPSFWTASSLSSTPYLYCRSHMSRVHNLFRSDVARMGSRHG